jgi:DNA mismatch endonuclease (patch repair protein)
MDIVSKQTRSRMMASVRSRGNRSTEKALGDVLRAEGIRGYRKHWKVEGKPDFAWPGRKIAIFVDGCFWHGCGRCRNLPKSNAAFWRDKILSNKRRDRRVTQHLRRAGWLVIRVKECAVLESSTTRSIRSALNSRSGRRGH